MITIIFGLPRAGKTALLTNFALEQMRSINAHRNIRTAKKMIDPLNRNGFHYTLPTNHMVFSDFPVYSDRHYRRISYELDGFYLGLPNKTHPTVFIPPCSQIFLDEAQKYYNSRMSSSMSDFVSRFYELHGHYKLNLTMTVQRPGLVDLNIRELAMQIIEVVKLEHKLEHGHITSSTWTCNLFDNSAKALSYIEAGKTGQFGERVKYHFEGNIFKHYNSYNFFPSFLKDFYEADYDLMPGVPCMFNKQSIIDFNDTHDSVVPDTYYKRGSKK